MEVLNKLKPGLDEKLYERAMIIELKRHEHDVSIQTPFPVYYRGKLIGNLVPDLIVDNVVIVDCSNDRVSKHRRLRPRASHQFQKRPIGMETSVASAGWGASRSSCLILPIRDIRVIRGSLHLIWRKQSTGLRRITIAWC